MGIIPPHPENQQTTSTNFAATSTSTPESTTSDNAQRPVQDLEKNSEADGQSPETKVSAFKSLGLLDRFLALWILLAMIIGILLGNFVPNTGPALQRGQFVGVSVPIGKLQQPPLR